MAKKTGAIKRKLARGKTWYKILAPKAFNQVEIGEALSSNPDNLKKRIINVQYSTLSGNITKQYIKTRLRANDVEGESVHTELIGYEISKPYLQRVIRRRSSKIDDTVDMKLRDKNVRIKIIAITLKKANASQRTALRNAIKVEVLKNMRDFTFDNLVIALASGKPQKMIQKKIKTIFPVRFFEVRKIEMLSDKKIKADFGKETIKEVSKKESKRKGKKITTEPMEDEAPKQENEVVELPEPVESTPQQTDVSEPEVLED